MKITSRISKLKSISCLRSLALAVAAVATAFGMQAQTEGVPEIYMYYPGVSTPPQNLLNTSKAYVYFKSPAKVSQAKAKIIQGDNSLGTLTYKAKNPGTNATMDPADAANTANSLIEPGEFTLEFFEVTYLNTSGETVTHSDMNTPLGSVTYIRPSSDGKIVSETGFEDKQFLSYYAPGSDGGVKTYTFDKSVVPAGVKATLHYGIGNNIFDVTVNNVSFSNSDKTMTIDFRGMLNNNATIANGFVFTDIDGTILTVNTITLEVTGLVCTDGSLIATVSTDIDGNYPYTQRGKIWQNFWYTDLTFPTPEITSAKFYNSAAPDVTKDKIDATTDMMVLGIDNTDCLVSTDVRLTAKSIEALIPFAEITVNKGNYSFALPESIKEAGSDDLVVRLVNTAYSKEDGATHDVKPFDFGNGEKTVYSVAEARAFDPQTPVWFDFSENGLKVTLSNSAGYMFAEDATGGIQFMLLDDAPEQYLPEGALIKGRIYGTVTEGDSSFCYNEADAHITAAPTDISKGYIVKSLDELTDGKYDNCLVTVVANENLPIVNDEGDITIGGPAGFAVVTDFLEDSAEIPAEINNVTGICYMGMMLIVRSADDFNQADTSGIESVSVSAESPAAVYSITGVKVRNAGDDLRGLAPGIYVKKGTKIIVK